MTAFCDRSSCHNSASWYAYVPMGEGEDDLLTTACDYHARTSDRAWRHILSGLPMAPKASEVLRFLMTVWPYGKTAAGMPADPMAYRHLDLGHRQPSPTIYQDTRAGQYGIRWADFGEAFKLLARYKRFYYSVLDAKVRREALDLGLTGEEWL